VSAWVSRRPAPAQRCFVSPAIDTEIERVTAGIADPELAWLFSNCLPNTLDTTVRFTDGTEPDTFVITGDIPAMWLRDSTAQVWPYVPFARRDEGLCRMLAGVINRQVACLLIDPYANAFEPQTAPGREPSTSHWAGDATDMHPRVHERKWELDSPCAVIRLCHGYWQATGDTSPFGAAWLQAMHAVLAVMREQQTGTGSYRFQEAAALSMQVQAALDALPSPWAYEIDGYGNQLFIDDANVPSLLSLPYLGAYDAGDDRYQSTRTTILSAHNPFFAQGAAGQGQGSPHTGPGTVWPLGLAMQALTSSDDTEIRFCLAQLKSTHAGTGFMHEAFDCQDAARFSRPWFAWANSLFGELILGIERQRPHLLASPLGGTA
jgi:meiotically up-regulated gene 157 (Mug157) protein